jgi:hypothetical protein
MLRYERKYLVPNHCLDRLRSRLRTFVIPDLNADSNTDIPPQYTVRSIYFDNRNLDCYYEKVEGLKDRKKLRIRAYNTYSPGCNVFLEVKRKLENRIKKNRALVPFDSLSEVLSNGNVDELVVKHPKFPRGLDDAKIFLYQMHTRMLRPVSLIVYDREPYHGKYDFGVRITFDKNIRSAVYPAIGDLFNEKFMKPILNGYFILEIKYFTDNMPAWARSIVEEFGLQHEALSKYMIGLQRSVDLSFLSKK